VPYEALADFSRRLGDGLDPAALLPAVAQAAGMAVKARRVAVALHTVPRADEVATWPPSGVGAATAPGIEVPVVDHDERLGSITVTMPDGRPLRPRDRVLLADLADQAGIAFRNTQLTAELAGHVEELEERNRELDDSRRRLSSAGDAERSRLEEAISRKVFRHLAPVPDQLRRLSQADRNQSSPDLGSLIESVNTSLEALREITRGVFPAQLTRSGLPAALASLLARTPGDGRLVVADSAAARRYDAGLEAAVYFCVVEAARDLSGAIVVALSEDDGELRVVVSGGAGAELPLGHMRDRVKTAGGVVSRRVEGENVVLEIRAPTHQRPAAAQNSSSSSTPNADFVT
jgi:hypothetical protein